MVNSNSYSQLGAAFVSKYETAGSKVPSERQRTGSVLPTRHAVSIS